MKLTVEVIPTKIDVIYETYATDENGDGLCDTSTNECDLQCNIFELKNLTANG